MQSEQGKEEQEIENEKIDQFNEAYWNSYLNLLQKKDPIKQDTNKCDMKKIGLDWPLWNYPEFQNSELTRLCSKNELENIAYFFTLYSRFDKIPIYSGGQ